MVKNQGEISGDRANFCTILSAMDNLYKVAVELSNKLYVLKNKLGGNYGEDSEVISSDEDAPYICGIVPTQKELSQKTFSQLKICQELLVEIENIVGPYEL